MEDALEHFFASRNTAVLLGLIAVILYVLGKAADKLVGEAVVLAERSGLPKVIIGATIVSLGTTSPEAAVSVLAAIQGQPELALGNAVGSIICDAGLILGVAILISPPFLDRKIVNRQGWIQFGAGVLLVLMSWPWGVGPWIEGKPLEGGGNLHQAAGVLFVFLLGVYLWLSVKWAKESGTTEKQVDELEEHAGDIDAPLPLVIGKLLGSVAVVVAMSHLLIPAIGVAAERMGVPPAIVAATLVAFGTSLPELVTAVTASRKGHGDLAVGNVIGADILNVLFVAGLSAAVTPAGLDAPPSFFKLQFPAMLTILVVFRVAIFVSGDRLKRPFGVILLALYAVYTVLNFVLLG
ncbi:MAG: calcium/sodium antiporter [Planctomycetota bacterium]